MIWYGDSLFVHLSYAKALARQKRRREAFIEFLERRTGPGTFAGRMQLAIDLHNAGLL